MEDIFELEVIAEERVAEYLDEYNTLLSVYDHGLRHVIVTDGGESHRDGYPYNPVKLMNAPLDPNIAMLLFVREKSEKMAEARAAIAREEAESDPELAEIRKKKLQKLSGK